MKGIAIPVLLSFLLSSCVSPLASSSTSTLSPTSTHTTIPTATATSTPTFTPTATFTSTPTPTVVLPLADGAALPGSLQVIEPDNVSSLVLIRRLELSSSSSGYAGGILFTPDSKMLALAMGNDAYGNPVNFWNIVNGELMSVEIEGNSSIAFSPDGTLMASASKGNWPGGKVLDIRNMDQPEVVWTAAMDPTGPYVVGPVSFSPDGKFLEVSDSAGFRIYDTSTWKLSQTVPFSKPDPGFMLKVAISPDWKTLAAASGEKFYIREFPSGLLIHNFDGIGEGLSFSPSSEYLASNLWNQPVYVWDVINGKLLFKTQENLHSSWVGDAFSPDGHLLVVPSDQLYIYQVPDGNLIRVITVEGTRNQIIQAAISSDGKLIAFRRGSGWVYDGSVIEIWGIP